MILIFEMTWTGTQHAPGNSATIQTIARAAPEQAIRIHADASHLAELGKDTALTGLPQVSFHPIATSPHFRDKPHIVSLRRGLREFATLWRCLHAVPRDEPCLLMLISATPTAIFAASLLARLSRRRIGVQIGLHGNLNEIHDWRSRNPALRAFDLPSALAARHPPNLRFLVLEEAIRSAMAAVAPSAAAITDVLPLPVNAAEAPAEATVELELPLRIGLVGQATEAKGVTPFLQLANELRARHGDKVSFHVLGRAPPGSDLTRFAVLAEPVTHAYLDRNEFRRRIAGLHFVCLPLQAEYYGLSASGALLDAITWLKPLIATRLPLIRFLADRFGDIGYLCDDAAQMRQAVEKLLANPDPERYRSQVEALRKARQARTPEALARDYQVILRDGFGGLSLRG